MIITYKAKIKALIFSIDTKLREIGTHYWSCKLQLAVAPLVN